MTPRRRIALPAIGAVVALLSVALTSTAALAHDSLTGADPRDGSTVSTLSDVSLTYSGAILGDEGANIVQVIGPDGRYYETACPALAGPVVTTPVAPGAAGTYEVLWRVVSSDGHPVSGSYTFEYAPATATDVAAAGSATPLCGAAAGASAGSATNGDGGAPDAGGEAAAEAPGLGIALGLGIGAAAALVIALGAWLLIRRPAASDDGE